MRTVRYALPAKKLLMSALFLALFYILPEGYAANLLRNPGFEDARADGMPESWSVHRAWEEASLTGRSFRGSKAFVGRAVRGDREGRLFHGVTQRVAVEPGEYELEFYTRFTGDGYVNAMWQFMDSKGDRVEVEGFRWTDRVRSAQNWTRVHEVIEVPVRASRMRITLNLVLLEDLHNEGLVFFDEVSLTRLDRREEAVKQLPEGAELVLEEDFSDGVIPAGWEAASGEWAVKNNALYGRGPGAKIFYTGGVSSPNMRVEYTAWTEEEPRDLSAILGQESPFDERNGYFFGFGSNMNEKNKILSPSGEVLAERGGALEVFEDGIVPGEKHRVMAERYYNELRLFVDGELVLEGNDVQFASSTGESFGFYIWGDGYIDDVKVYALPYAAGAAAAERDIEFKLYEDFEGYGEGEGRAGFMVERSAPGLSVVNRPTWVYREPVGNEYVDDRCLEMVVDEGAAAVISRRIEPLSSGIAEFDILAEEHTEFRMTVRDGAGKDIINLVIDEEGRFLAEEDGERRVLRDTITYQRRRFDADFRLMNNRWYTFRLHFDSDSGMNQVVLIDHYSEIKSLYTLGFPGEYLPLDASVSAAGGREAEYFSLEARGANRLYLDNLVVFGPVGTDRVNGRPLSESSASLLGLEHPPRKDPFQLKIYSYRHITEDHARRTPLYHQYLRGEAPKFEYFKEAGNVYDRTLVNLAFLEERTNMLGRSALYVEDGSLRRRVERAHAGLLGRMEEAERLQEEALNLYAEAYLSDNDEGKLDAFYAVAGRVKALQDEMEKEINAVLEALLALSPSGEILPCPSPRPEGELEWNIDSGRWERNGEPAVYPYLRPNAGLPLFRDGFKLLGYPKYDTAGYFTFTSINAEEGEFITREGPGAWRFRGFEINTERGSTGYVNIITGRHYTGTAAPGWWVEKHMEKDEDIIFARNDGTPFDPAVHPRSGIGRQYLLNYWHPLVKELIYEQFSVFGKLAEGSSAAEMLIIAAEGANRLPGRQQPGYNRTAVEAFRGLLKEKYGDIGNLNRLWGSGYGSFDEITPPRGVTKPSGLQYEFRKFMHDGYNEWLRSKTEVLNRYAPGHPTAADMQNTFGGSATGPAHDPVGFFRAANIRLYHTYQGWDRKFVDRWNYQLGAATGVPWGTLEWAISQGSPYMFQLEEIRNNGLREKFMHMMWGASMFNIYGWMHGNWQYQTGLHDPRLDYTVFNYTAPFNALYIDRINRIGEKALTVPAVKPRVGMLEAKGSYYNGLRLRDRMRDISVELAETGWDFEFLYEQLLEEGLQGLQGTEVLFMPLGLCMSESLREEVYGWVESGGVLISVGGPAGIMDEYGQPVDLRGVYGADWRETGEGWELSGRRPFFEGGGAKGWESEHGAGRAFVFDGMTPEVFRVMERHTERMFGSDSREIQFCMRDEDGVKYLYALNWSVYDTEEFEIFVEGGYGSIKDIGLQVPLEVSRREAGGRTYFRTKLAPGEGTLFKLQ